MAKSEKKAKDQVDVKTSSDTGAVIAERPNVIEPFRWMGDWFDHWPPMLGRRLPGLFDQGLGLVESMRVEEYVDDDGTVIRVEVPGVDPDEDIDISVSGDKLTVSATREERKTKTGNGYRSEFHYGSLRRTMTLPQGTEADDVTATYQDGILEIRVPMSGESKAKTKVPIQRTGKD